MTFTLLVNNRRCNKCLKCEDHLPGLLSFPYGMDFRSTVYMHMEEKIDKALEVCDREALTLRVS